MRFHLVTETFHPETNGVAMTLHRLVQELSDRGTEVTVIRPKQFRNERSRAEDYAECLVLGYPIPSYPDLRFGLASGGFFERTWSANRPELVHVATEGPLGFMAIWMARRLKIPVVSSFHTNFDQYGDYYHFSTLKKWALAYLKFLHNRSLATYAPSEEMMAQLQVAGFKNVCKLGRGVDSTLFSPRKRSDVLRLEWDADPDTLVCLFTGRVAAEKNIPFAIECYQSLKQTHPSCRMVVVGDGPIRQQLEARYPDVIFCGKQTGESLARHYASADLFIFPSTTETYGNVVVEAMASGLAVMTYNYAAGGLLIESGINGFLAPFKDPVAFCEQLLEIAYDMESLQQVRKKARETVIDISWEKVTHDYLNTLQKYIKSDPLETHIL